MSPNYLLEHPSLPLRKNFIRSRLGLLSDPSIWAKLERVDVLGDDRGYGHLGCVNALSWQSNGETLISSGDDVRLCIWKFCDGALKCDTVISTGHTNNVFNAQFLPSSSKVITCAADREVRVFDIVRSGELTTSDACTRVIKCHRGRVKRVVIQDSDNYFLTVSEDKTVREHDLRAQHNCPSHCPPPLLRVPHSLSTLAVSPLAPFYFVVAGESPFGYLFDRRMIPRVLRAEWGQSCEEDGLVSCVRRFGRASRAAGERSGSEHVTGARMAQSNSHELLMSYSADAVYLYSVKDDPVEPSRPPSMLPSNKKRRKLDYNPSVAGSSSPRSVDANIDAHIQEQSPHQSSPSKSEADDMEYSESEEEEVDEDDPADDSNHDDDDGDDEDEDYAPLSREADPLWLNMPVVYPRQRFSGACNVETVKDVNFIGPHDDYVAQGSDDGNFFLWNKTSADIIGIWEGDGSVVNVIEPHPFLPLLAVSGIDSTIKLFEPDPPEGERPFTTSRIAEKDKIIGRNTNAGSRRLRTHALRLDDLLVHFGLPRDHDTTTRECHVQ